MRLILASLVVPAVCLLAPWPGQAEEGGDALDTRIYHVGALIKERYERVAPAPGAPGPDDVSDERHPLFGAEWEGEEEPPFGSQGQIVELIETLVSPDFWDESERAKVEAFGETMIIATATPEVHDAVGRFLIQTEARTLGTITVDLQVLRVPEADAARLRAASDAAATAVIESLQAAAGPGRVLSITAHAGESAMGYDGAQHAFVQDADVEVSDGISIVDPIVGVANAGLGAVVRARPTADARVVSLTMRAFFAERRPMRRQKTDSGFEMELPVFELSKLDCALDVRAGRWVVADGTATGADGRTRVFLVRATPNALAVRRTAAPIVLETATAPPSGKMDSHFVSIASLLEVQPWRRGSENINLWPSNFTPPEPPELPEQDAPISTKRLVRLVRSTVAPDSWQQSGAGIHVMKNGQLLLMNRQSVLATARERVEQLRVHLRWKVVTIAQIVDVPASLAATLCSASARAGTALAPAAMEALKTALGDGRAKVVQHVQVSSLRNARNVVNDGQRLAYLQDYEVEVSKEAAIPNPVVKTVFAGTVLDAQSTLCADNRTVSLTINLSHTGHEEPIRVVETMHGPIELPVLAVWRVGTALTVPVGATAIAGVAGEGERRRILLVSPRVVVR